MILLFILIGMLYVIFILGFWVAVWVILVGILCFVWAVVNKSKGIVVI